MKDICIIFFTISIFFIGRIVESSKMQNKMNNCVGKHEYTELDKKVVRAIPFDAGQTYIYGVWYECYLGIRR